MLGVLQIQGNIFTCLGWLVFRPLRKGEGKVLSTHFSSTPCLLPWSNAVGIHPNPYLPHLLALTAFLVLA